MWLETRAAEGKDYGCSTFNSGRNTSVPERRKVVQDEVRRLEEEKRKTKAVELGK